jgi:hypothetical protein
MGMLTLTYDSLFPRHHRPSQWNTLLAQDQHDKDLEFDEGLEEDDLDQPKPPSKKPIFWILALILALGLAYWSLQPSTTLRPTPPGGDSALVPTAPGPKKDGGTFIPAPQFQENQVVSLGAETREVFLLADLRTGAPGSIVKTGETMVILDGHFQSDGWMYQVKTKSGQVGWIKGTKLQHSSS